MSWVRLGLGLGTSVFIGALVIWLIIDKWAFRGQKMPEARGLTLSVGMLERFLYTMALLAGQPLWFGVWLALKGLHRWSSFESHEPSYNIFLIGNGLSVAFGVLGAWIAKNPEWVSQLSVAT